MSRAWKLTAAALCLLAACGDAGSVPSSPVTTRQVVSLTTEAPAGTPEPTAETAAPTSQAGEPATTTTADGLPGVALVPVVEGISPPSYVTSPPADGRLFVLEKTGAVRVVQDGRLLTEPFLDVSERLAANGEGDDRGRIERGLLTMAFHPDFAQNGRFFVYYADNSGMAELVEYLVSEDPNRADVSSGRVLLEFDSTIRHYGGELAFAPDGTLWLSVGTGGDNRLAAEPNSLRGSMLRLDVSAPGVAAPAAGNPYLDGGGEPLIWATGLRNPWRWSIDPETGLLYVADVGHQEIEEVSVVPAGEPGLNYGWPVLEGSECFKRASCSAEGLVLPVFEYTHDQGCAIIGGFVYRGRALPELAGHYFYADFCARELRSFRYEDGAVTDARVWLEDLGAVASLGRDAEGELYVTTFDGVVLKLVRAS